MALRSNRAAVPERAGRLRYFCDWQNLGPCTAFGMVPFSILDLSPVVQGGTPADALHRSRDLAQHAEKLGYQRYWLAEHHNMTGIASAATAVVIGHVAAGTSTIRVGSGGIMLPNHAPLVIAEQFGTLASLFPGRIDLGLGRAPGTDQVTARALRRGNANSADTFPQDVMELQSYFRAAVPNQAVQAVPGAGLEVPIWLLGSSLFSAQVAAALGLPFAFASHFAPDQLMEALDVYRREYSPSEKWPAPYAMAAIQVVAAPTDEEARFLFTSQQQAFLKLRRGTPGLLPPPIQDLDTMSSALEQSMIGQAFREAVVGSAATVKRGIEAFLERTKVNELMVTGALFDHAARKRSLELTASIRR
ncbi:MAG: limB [Verrucomicrobia bacterium]|nr:limB [Verrucomicrobiota bacterium]